MKLVYFTSIAHAFMCMAAGGVSNIEETRATKWLSFFIERVVG